jgi:fructose-bisphosphate aldolase class II
MPKLDFDRLARIRKETSVFLVLHGGSGLSADDFKKAIMGGINKINLNTELRVLWKEKMKKSLNDSSRVKPYEILPEIIVETKKLVEKYLKIFGTSTKV